MNKAQAVNGRNIVQTNFQISVLRSVQFLEINISQGSVATLRWKNLENRLISGQQYSSVFLSHSVDNV